MMGSKAFESPLIPHARMRALYRALVETRVLGKSRTADAALVATSIDLHPGDLTSLPHSAWLADHIRRVATREAPTIAQLVRTLRARKAATPSPHAPLDRLLLAAGMAIASKATQNVVVAFADKLPARHWKHLLSVASPGHLPLILVTPGDPAAIAKRIGTVPVIRVDAGDVVALYRVAQETIVRARADGGVAIIQCIPCDTDPVRLLATQLLAKKICTPRWIAAVDANLRKHLVTLKHRSRADS